MRLAVLIRQQRHEGVRRLNLIEQGVPPALSADEVAVVEGLVAEGIQIGHEGVGERLVQPRITDE